MSTLLGGVENIVYFLENVSNLKSSEKALN